MAPEIWTFLSSAVVSASGIAVVYLQNRKQHHENQVAAEQLQKRVEPVSNGFAGTVTQALTRIELRLDDHITDHNHSGIERPQRRRMA